MHSKGAILIPLILLKLLKSEVFENKSCKIVEVEIGGWCLVLKKDLDSMNSLKDGCVKGNYIQGEDAVNVSKQEGRVSKVALVAPSFVGEKIQEAMTRLPTHYSDQ